MAADEEDLIPSDTPDEETPLVDENAKKKAELLQLLTRPKVSPLTQDVPVGYAHRWGPGVQPIVSQPAVTIEPGMNFVDEWNKLSVPPPQGPVTIEPGMNFEEEWRRMLPPLDETTPAAPGGGPLPQGGKVDTPLERITSIVKLISGLPSAGASQSAAPPSAATDEEYSKVTSSDTHRSRDNLYGKYQIPGRSISALTKKWYGQELTPAQFIQSKEAQDAIYEGETGQSRRKFNSNLQGKGVTVDTAEQPVGQGAERQPQPSGPLSFVTSRGGHSTGAAPPVNPEFAARLAAAGQAYEAETGNKAYFGELARDRATQARYYARFKSTGKGLAAPPGRSRHEGGEGVDIRRGDFRTWLAEEGNAKRFGIETLKGRAYARDPVHFQLNHGDTRSFRTTDAEPQGEPTAMMAEAPVPAAPPTFINQLNKMIAQLNPVSSAQAQEMPQAPMSAGGLMVPQTTPQEPLPAPSVTHTDDSSMELPEVVVTPDEEPPLPTPEPIIGVGGQPRPLPEPGQEPVTPVPLAGAPPGQGPSSPQAAPAQLPATPEGRELASLALPPTPGPTSLDWGPPSEPAPYDTGTLQGYNPTRDPMRDTFDLFTNGITPELGKKPVRLNDILSNIGDTYSKLWNGDNDPSGLEATYQIAKTFSADTLKVFDYMADHYNIPSVTDRSFYTGQTITKVAEAAKDTLKAFRQYATAGLLKLPTNITQATVGSLLDVAAAVTRNETVFQMAAYLHANTDQVGRMIERAVVDEGMGGLAGDLGDLTANAAMLKGWVARGFVAMTPEIAKLLEKAPDLPTVDDVNKAFVSPAVADEYEQVMQTAQPVPGTDKYVVNTLFGGPVTVTKRDILTGSKMAALTGGWMLSPWGIRKLAENKDAMRGILNWPLGRYGSPIFQPIGEAPRTLHGDAGGPLLNRSTVWDYFNSMSLSATGPLTDIQNRFRADAQASGRAGLNPKTAQEVLDMYHIYGDTQVNNRISSMFNNGVMTTPTMEFRIRVPENNLKAMQKHAETRPYLKRYLQLKQLEDQLLHSQTVVRDAISSGKTGQALQDVMDLHPQVFRNERTRAYEGLNDVRRALQDIEQRDPLAVQFGQSYRDYIKEGRRLMSDGRYAQLSPTEAMNLETIGPNTPSFSIGATKNRDLWQAAREHADPLKTLEAELERNTRRRFKNETTLAYIDALPEGIQFERVAPGQRLTEAELRRRSISDDAVLTIRRQGVTHTYVADPMTVGMLDMSPASYRGVVDNFFRYTKAGFQQATTGVFQPAFAPTAMIRSAVQMMHTIPKWSSYPGPLAQVMEPFRQMVNPIREHAEWLKQQRFTSWIPPQYIDRAASVVSSTAAHDFNKALEHAGGKHESFLIDAREQRRHIVRGRSLAPNDPAHQRLMDYLYRVTKNGLPGILWRGSNAATNAISDNAFKAWARKNAYAPAEGIAGSLGFRSRTERRIDPVTGQPMSLSKIAGEMRRLTGDPSDRGTRKFQTSQGLSRDLPFETSTAIQGTKLAMAKGAGTLTEIFHSTVPWSGILIRSPASTISAMANHPMRTMMWFGTSQIMPEALAYFWNKQLGQEYLDHMMDGLSDHQRRNYTYYGVIGRKPHEGFMFPQYQEGYLARRTTSLMLEQFFGRSQFSMQEEMWDMVQGFLQTNLIPPPPPLISATMGAFGVPLNEGWTSTPRTTTPRDWRELNQQDNVIEAMVRGFQPAVADYWTQFYQSAHANSGGTWEKVKSGAQATGHRFVERMAIVNDFFNVDKMAPGSTRINEQMYARRAVMNDITRYLKESSPYIRGKGRSSKEGSAMIRDQIPDILLPDAALKPGLYEREPTNPFFNAALAVMQKKYRTDTPSKGGGGFISLWNEYEKYNDAIDSMRKVADGNRLEWSTLQKTVDSDIQGMLRRDNVPTDNFRAVRNYLLINRNKLATHVFDYMRQTEEEIDKLPEVRQALGPGRKFKIDMMKPHKTDFSPGPMEQMFPGGVIPK